MKLERNRVSFPLWRKKVDKSLLEIGATPIPGWACKMWKFELHFANGNGAQESRVDVQIQFENRTFQGWITIGNRTTSSRSKLVRLWFGDDVKASLKRTYVMSYMRSLENELSEETSIETETRIPFWEFLDIECDAGKKTFHFEAHYKQVPTFPHLFTRLLGSPNLQRLSDQMRDVGEIRILKQNWKKRSEYRYEVGARNVIYLLADTKRKLLYVGEATDLVRRLQNGHSLISDWDHFRYDVLPDVLKPYRVHLERMLIRYLAALVPSGREISHLGISEYRLVNAKVDR